jgi:hypothetical protein
MGRFTSMVIGAAVICLGAMGSGAIAGISDAAPPGDGNAQDTVNALQAAGYAVQFNGNTAGSLSSCSVTGVHGLPNDPATGGQPPHFTTVYVDLDCTSNN